jgi:glycerol-3-phosphate acyltransferase PlsY
MRFARAQSAWPNTGLARRPFAQHAAAVLGPGLALFGYLLGSISFAVIAGKRAGIDIHAEGSGNPGATNVGRVLGKRTGRVVLVLDLLKGAVPAGLASILLGPDAPWTAAAGFAAALGHCFPVWHRFRGGKGAATAAGVLLVLVPFAGAASIVTYLVGKRASRRASVGSLLGALAGAATTFALLSGPRTWMSGAIVVLVFVRHADNLARLAKGTEPES